MTRVLACVAVAALAAAAGCTKPDYGDGHLQCAPSTRICPSGFYCAADDHCWRNGSGPPAGMSDGDLATPPLDLAAADLSVIPSNCASSSALLCESFESPLMGWSQSVTNGTAARDTTRAYRGTSSLRAHVSASAAMTGPSANIAETRTFPVAGTLYVRMWAFFPSGLPTDFNQFFVVADNGNSGISLATANGYFVLNNFTVPKYYHQSSTPVPLDRWVCIQFDAPQAGGAIHVAIDGTPMSDLGQTLAPVPAISEAAFGSSFYNNTNPIPDYDAWFDEIIVDNKPTTCDE
jgi:hypothetical protein